MILVNTVRTLVNTRENMKLNNTFLHMNVDTVSDIRLMLKNF